MTPSIAGMRLWHEIPSLIYRTHIPLLADVLCWAVENDMGLIVEVKQRNRHDKFVSVLVELTTSNRSHQPYPVLASIMLINQVKAQIPQLALQVVTLERYNNQLAAVQQSNASCVCFEFEFAHIGDLRAYKKAGLGIRMFLHEVRMA